MSANPNEWSTLCGVLRKRWADLLIATWAGCLIVGVFVLDSLAPGGRPVVKLGGIDPVYYFANAHSLLFDFDFDLSNQLDTLQLDPKLRIFPGHKGAQGRPGSPWAIGYSILSIPFLAVGSLVDAVEGRSPDGYGPAALRFFYLANPVFVGVGLLFLVRFLQRFGIPPPAAALVVLTIWFSTTLVYYTYTPIAHAATFLMACAFLLTWSCAKDGPALWVWGLLGFCGGLLFICRWQDGVFLLAPLLFEIRQRPVAWRKWLVYVAAAGVPCIPQIVQWHAVYGHYITMPYGRSFIVFPPYFIGKVLFSTNHGWFVWTPIAVIGLVGLLVEIRRSWPWILVIFLELAIIGSLPTGWSGGESFGMRTLTSCVPLVAMGVAILVSRLSGKWKVALVAVTTLCGVYTTLFAIQFRLDLIPRFGRLTFSQIVTDKIFLYRAYQRHKLGH